jgi:hypothetical protein
MGKKDKRKSYQDQEEMEIEDLEQPEEIENDMDETLMQSDDDDDEDNTTKMGVQQPKEKKKHFGSFKTMGKGTTSIVLTYLVL